MLPTLGALSSVLDALLSPTSSKSPPSQQPGSVQTTSNPFDLTGNDAASGTATPASSCGGCSQISPATLRALLAAQSQSTASSAPTSRTGALKDLFSQLEADGDGQVSKSEFDNALGAGGTNLARADDVFGKLDTSGDGSVSLDELTSALKGAGGRGHHRHHPAAGAQDLSSASSTQVTNSDGTITTSLTYADGSKVTLTSPPVTKSPSAATSSYNFVERLIQREANAIQSAAVPALSFNV